MNRTLAMLNVVGLFVVGILVGAFAMHLWDERGPERDRPFRGGPPGERHERLMMEDLERELDLTAEQKDQVVQILSDSREQAEAWRREMEPRLREHIRATRAQIADVLDPDQKEKFEELSRRHRRGAERFFLGHGFPPRGPGGRPMGPRDRWRDRPGPGPGPRGRRQPEPPPED